MAKKSARREFSPESIIPATACPGLGPGLDPWWKPPRRGKCDKATGVHSVSAAKERPLAILVMHPAHPARKKKW
jgi:hypothetical protein